MKLTVKNLKRLILEEIESLSEQELGVEKTSASELKTSLKDTSKKKGATGKERDVVGAVCDKLMKGAQDGNLLKSKILKRLERAMEEIDKLLNEPEAEEAVPGAGPGAEGPAV
tara:strand:+ start:1785 stop:2123 length:339 start_codon:yes stop_codon:yes gene_type:complete